jgi:uncharacterized protein YecE (DUF72 family)
MNHYSVYLGAVGWAQAQWVGSFYPEDLPGDWQLSFYNSEFRCVYLPYAMWRKASDAEVAVWIHDTKAGFRFVLQWPENAGEDDKFLARRFGERAVLEGQCDLLWLEGAPDLRKLAQRMQKAVQSGSPLFLVSRDGSLTQLRQVSELMDVLGV